MLEIKSRENIFWVVPIKNTSVQNHTDSRTTRDNLCAAGRRFSVREGATREEGKKKTIRLIIWNISWIAYLVQHFIAVNRQHIRRKPEKKDFTI